MIGALNHVGVATPSIADSIKLYRDILGATKIGEPFDLPAQGVKVCFVDTPTAQIELIEPYDETSPIVGFLARIPRAASTTSVSRSPTSTPPSPKCAPRG